ncbi:hypothetical protein T492DRAFT_874525 [Pavlovales sp. CCMP2436]|nr:hypothetical protein T492DRAFT_874525 [Pavlovales sp. CCMP2436]
MAAPPKCPGTLGDIIPESPPPCPISPGFDPDERIVLMANGNLQRLMSSYYNATVSVAILRNAPCRVQPYSRPAPFRDYQRRRALGRHGEYAREVQLSVLGTRQC